MSSNQSTGRCSIYIRLSKEARAENLSVSGMEQDCRALAKNLGYAVYATHIPRFRVIRGF